MLLADIVHKGQYKMHKVNYEFWIRIAINYAKIALNSKIELSEPMDELSHKVYN